jgi:predicted metal-dependent hydrolase
MKPYLYPQQELQRRALSWAVRLKVNPALIRIETMGDRWGCCTSAGEITFAAELAEMDEPFQDYVIVHELLHLRLPTHNRRFKALMSAYIPEWRSLDARTRETRSASDGSPNTRSAARV